jgi:hypothetical protein
MFRRISFRVLVAGVMLVAAAAWLSADTLVLRDGRRVTGDLIAVRNGTIEFQERGVYNSKLIRVSRDEVRRIEIDENVVEERPERPEPGRPGP